MEENFLIDLVGGLDQRRSQKQVNADIKTLERTINKLRLTATLAKGNSKKEINAYIKTLSNQLSTIKLKAKIDSKNIKSAIDSALNKVSFKDIDVLNIDENKTKLKMQKVFSDTKSFVEKNPIVVGISISSKKSKLDNDLTTYLNRNTKINESSVLLKEANKVRDLIDTITDKKSLTEATDAFRLFKSEVSATGFASKSTADKVKSMLGHVTKIGSTFGVASMLINNFTKSLKTLQSNDTILTEISKTSEMTKSQLKELGDEAFKTAGKYGQLSSNYLLAVQEMARSGYEETSKELGELSLLTQSAGDMTAENANNYLLATDAAYKYGGSVEKLNAALDGANFISNRNSASLTEIADATRVSASFAANAGVAIDELTAAEATMIATTKRSGSEIGRAFRSIVLNLQQVSGEFDGEIIDEEQLKKVESRCHSLGVELEYMKDGIATLRNPIEVLKDLAEVYNSLPDNSAEKQGLISDLGGKYHANALSALLSRWDMYEKMLGEFSQGAGSALEEAEKTANSWEGRLNSLQNSFDSFVNTLTNKEAVKGGISFFDRLIQGAEGFVDIFGEIPTVLTAVNSSMVILNKNYGLTKVWDKETKKVDIEGNIFGIDFSAIKNQKKHYDEAAMAIKRWNKELVSGKADLEVFGNACVKNITSLKEYLSTTSKDAPASLKGYKAYLQSTGQATEDLRLKTLLLNTTLTLLGSIAVQAVITGIANAFDKFNETVVESKEKVDGINSKISDLKTQLEELNNLEYKSDFDKQKISQLERELALQEKILEIELKRLYQNQIGTRFSDYFDKDSLITKQQAEYDRNNKENFANLSRGYDTYKSSLNDIDAELTSLQEKLNSEDLIGHNRFVTEGRIIELTEKRNDLLEKQQTIEDQLTVNMGEYLKNYQTAQEAVDSGLLTGSDLEKAESMAEYWNQMYQDSTDIVENIQKMNGTYDDTDDKLEKMFGGISRDDLASLSDDDKRIALSFDPNNDIGFDELKKRIAGIKGDIEGLNGTEATIFNQLTSSEEALDKFQSSVKSVTEAYSTLLSGNYSSTELLDSIQAINKAVSDMGGSLNWEFINGQTDSLELLGDAIQHISQKYAESILSGAGIDINSEFGQMLAEIIQQIYDAEAAFEGMNSQLDNLQSSYQMLTGILESYNETGYISLDNLQSLLTADENLIQMLEVENGQLVLNQAAYENLVAVQLLEFKAKLNDAAAAEIETLAKQKAEQATNQNADASQNAVEKLDAETQAFNRNTSAAIANAVAKAEESGVSEEEIQGVFDKYTEVWNSTMSNYNVDFDSFMSGGKAAAGKAGGEAGDAYVDAFKEEYDHLKDMLDRGEISEAQYLSRLRALYTHYFKDRKKYLDEFKQYENEYLSGMLDLHNKALSGISTLLNRKTSAANDAKEASINALQEEKEAAEEAYQAQIDAIEKEKDALDDLIKEKNKQIDSINEEIDAIERASESRKKNINLQQQEYNLQKMLNQRVKSVYKEGEGFVFETDTSGIKDAREKVTEAKEALRIDGLKNEISLIQKEIDLLEEKKDSLSEEQERIQKLMDESNKYYDNLIKQQEKMWDSIIKGMEQNKSRWEELAEVEETAKAFSYIQQVFGDLGYTVEDVLNGSDAAFEDFKSRYIAIMSDMNQNTSFQEGLEYASGVAKEKFGSIVTDAQESVQELSRTFSDGTFTEAISKGVSDGIVAAQQELDKMNQLGSDAGEGFIEGWNEKAAEVSSATKQTAEEAIEAFAEGQDSHSPSKKYEGLAGDAVDGLLLGVEENKQAFIDTIRLLAEEGVLAFEEGFQFDESSIKTSFDSLILLIQSVSEALGFGSEGSIGGLLGALSQLSKFSLGDEAGSGILSQFTNLKSAIDEVTSAISGGGVGKSEGSSGGQGSGGKSGGGQSGGKGSKGEGGGGNSLTGAIESMGETAAEVIGEPDAEGDGTVIGEFGALETAVTDVTAAIGGGESEGGEGQGKGSGSEGEDGEGTLIGSIENLGETTQEELGESGGDGVIGKFEEFRDVIEEAATQVKSISEGLDEIDGKEVECTITINVKMNGTPTAYASGTVLGNMQIESATYNAKYGKAFANGTIGLPKDEKNALVSEYGQTEMTVLPDGKTIVTDTPTMMNLPKDTVIYNEEQTKKILSNKIDVNGTAHADGTDDDEWFILPNGERVREIRTGDRAYELQKAFEPLLKRIDGNLDILTTNANARYDKDMTELEKHVTNNVNNVTNNRNVQPVVHQNVTINCPNVTNESGAENIRRELSTLSLKAMQEPLKDY